MEEDEFLREFDEVTIGFPISEAGHLQSLCSGKGACALGEASWARSGPDDWPLKPGAKQAPRRPAGSWLPLGFSSGRSGGCTPTCPGGPGGGVGGPCSCREQEGDPVPAADVGVATQEGRCATLRSCPGPGSRASRREAAGTTAASPATPSSGCGSASPARYTWPSCRDHGCARRATQAGTTRPWACTSGR